MLDELQAGVEDAEKKIAEAEVAIRVLERAGENVTTQRASLKKAKAKVSRLQKALKTELR
jgi:exonuclease VII small subunit